MRDDATSQWEASPITPDARRAFVRAFGLHRDRETGVDRIFAGTGAGEVYSGAYDPKAPGRIRWDAEPEYSNPDFDGGAFKRCQGFCVANGKVYSSVAPRLLERQDGLKPEWVEVFGWYPEQRAGAGLRGITAVPALDGDHEVILGSREQEGRILRIDPRNDYQVELEMGSHVFLAQKWGRRAGGRLVAYNRFVPGTQPSDHRHGKRQPECDRRAVRCRQHGQRSQPDDPLRRRPRKRGAVSAAVLRSRHLSGYHDRRIRLRRSCRS